MSAEPGRVLADLGQAVQAYQAAVHDYDRETARLLGVNETDLRCLELLLAAGELSPRQLSAQLGLTSASVTAMLDRLEKAQLLTRTPHPVDRRKTIVTVTPEGAQHCYEIIGPHIEDSAKEIGTKYSAEQLQLITDFLRTNTTIQTRHTERLRSLPGPGHARATRKTSRSA